MADYWKSQPRKFCQYCKCWIADNKPSIEFHERGKNHKENVAAKISEIKKKSVQKAKQEDRMSKQFAAMEEAALKAYEEDLKRMEMDAGSGPCVQTTVLPQPKPPPLVLCEPPPHCKKYQKKTDKARKSSVAQNRTPIWVEGWTDNGHTYYYNTVSGDSQWERPEGFQSSSDFVHPGQHESTSSSGWTEGVSPEGYAYWYNTETGESRWEKPDEKATNETTESSLASASEKERPEEPTSGEGSCNEAQLPQSAEVTEHQRLPSTVPESSSRKRKADEERLGKDEDNQTSNKMSVQCVEEEEEKEEDKSTTTEPEKKKQEEVAKVMKSKSLNPYGAWEQIKEEKDPYASVDLQLPKVVEEVAPMELPPEPKPKFKERIITSLGVEGGFASFKKSKTQNGKSRSFRQRDNND